MSLMAECHCNLLQSPMGLVTTSLPCGEESDTPWDNDSQRDITHTTSTELPPLMWYWTFTMFSLLAYSAAAQQKWPALTAKQAWPPRPIAHPTIQDGSWAGSFVLWGRSTDLIELLIFITMFMCVFPSQALPMCHHTIVLAGYQHSEPFLS